MMPAAAALNVPRNVDTFYLGLVNTTEGSVRVSAQQEEEDDNTIPSGGKDCYGNERRALDDMERFFNNPLMSDVQLKVQFETFHAHRLILVKSSDVFERMFSSEWTDPNQQVFELVEEPECSDVFPVFLRFLYGSHIVLTLENSLPVLMLADKYNVDDLRQVCICFATKSIIPKLPLKDVFHIWYQYATKCYHQRLITACIIALSPKADDIMSLPEWSQEWMALDKSQLVQFLQSSDLTVRSELTLFRGVLKWIDSSKHPERSHKREELLRELVEYIRFPMMTPDQLDSLEKLPVVDQYPEMFLQHLLKAYKYNALTLEGRASFCANLENSENTKKYLLRNYTELRWDKRVVLTEYSKFVKFSEVLPRFSTRSSTYPHTNWDWELKIYPKGSSSNNEDVKVVLYSNVVLDNPRSVEYMISIVSSERTLLTVTGKKNFTKSRYFADTDIDKKLTVQCLSAPSSPYLVDDNLIFQVVIKPIQ